MALAGPWREQQKEPRVLGSADRAGLVWLELGHKAGPAAYSLAIRIIDLNSSRCDKEPRPLVNPVLLHLLAGRKLEDDQASLLGGVEDPRVARLHVHARNVPSLHDGESILTSLMVIAIDGPAGAGKSTVARGVAAALGITYLDSGAMYRCVALAASRNGADPDDADAIVEVASSLEISFEGETVSLGGEDVSAEIRAPRISALASRVSVHPGVRSAMVERQRELIAGGSYVAEGRDIGTVVSPDSPLKVFLTADHRGARQPPRRGVRSSNRRSYGRSGRPRPARHRA